MELIAQICGGKPRRNYQRAGFCAKKCENIFTMGNSLSLHAHLAEFQSGLLGEEGFMEL
jgi:hypothetical protein